MIFLSQNFYFVSDDKYRWSCLILKQIQPLRKKAFELKASI